MKISIINTYSPNNNGANENILNYWDNVTKYMETIPNNYIKIWRADNNGQISQNKHNNKVVGKWTMSNRIQKGNGVMISKTCVKYKMVCDNTCFCSIANNKSNLSTWYGWDGHAKNKLTIL